MYLVGCSKPKPKARTVKFSPPPRGGEEKKRSHFQILRVRNTIGPLIQTHAGGNPRIQKSDSEKSDPLPSLLIKRKRNGRASHRATADSSHTLSHTPIHLPHRSPQRHCARICKKTRVHASRGVKSYVRLVSSAVHKEIHNC